MPVNGLRLMETDKRPIANHADALLHFGRDHHAIMRSMRMKAIVTLSASCFMVCGVMAGHMAARAATPQTPTAQNQPPQPPLQEAIAADIPGVIKGGTKITLVRGGFKGTEGVIAMPDGSVLFTEQDADRIIRIDTQGQISTYLEHTNRTIGLGYDHKGRLIAAQSREPRIATLAPTTAILADTFEGQPLVRPNDLVIDRKNGIYFTDAIPNPQVAFRPPPPNRTPLLFYITPQGTLMKASGDLENVNGVQLSPDEKTLYATNGGTIMAFDVRTDGSLINRRVFAMSGGDGLAVDNAGRLYSAVAAAVGIRVFSPGGDLLGTIPAGVPPQSVGFAGRDKRTLFIVGRGAVYKTQMIAEGIRSRAK
jgi:gluconolactonase